jgi:outer membrane protein assembly factor BamA
VPRWVRALLVCILVLGCPGCFLKKEYPIDGPVVADVQLVGADSIDEDRLTEGLATRRSPKFLFWRGVAYDYEVLDEALLERDLDRVERFYRSQGYYEAKVVAARVVRVDAHTVRVVIAVSEGAKVAIPDSAAGGAMAVQIDGLEGVEDTRLVSRLIRASLKPGPFVESEYEDSKRELRQLLLDNGYAHAEVKGRVEIDLAKHEARVQYDLDPGRRCVIGSITIKGLRKIPEQKVRDSVLLVTGDRYSAAELEDARRALVLLGVFSSVSVEPDLSHPELDEVPVTFVVGETSPRTLRLGMGINLDTLQFSTRLTAGWEHRNFLGGLRHLSVEARPGAVLFPTRIGELQPPNRVMFTNQFRVGLDQPGFIEGRTRGTLSTELNVRPLLYTDTGADEAIIGFFEIKNQAGLERAFVSHRLLVTPSLNWQAELPIDYRSLSLGREPTQAAESGLDDVFVAYPELLLQYDLRDSPTEPKRGVFLSNSLQVALPVLGGNVSDVRIQPEVRGYVTKSKLTLAVRATTGLLFPRDYGDTLQGRVSNILTPEQIRDQQKLLFRAFFSGGPFSHRGYPVNGVGPHYVLGYLGTPGQRCVPVPGQSVDPSCLRPVGGLTLWELSLELRFPLGFLEPLVGALFLDSSDVREKELSYGIRDPHLSPGIGFRYPTPIGPVRADFGLRLFEALGKEDPQGTPPTLLGAPITISFAVGEAF